MIERNGILFPDAWGKLGSASVDMQRGMKRRKPEPTECMHGVRTQAAIKSDAADILTEQYYNQAERWA